MRPPRDVPGDPLQPWLKPAGPPATPDELAALKRLTDTTTTAPKGQKGADDGS